jgi:hypothetical protein
MSTLDDFFAEMQRLRNAVEGKRMWERCAVDDWNTLTSSMDALEDTHHAIAAFVAVASKVEPKLQERELGERYLRTYGVMQAFVIQQDAIKHVHKAIGMPTPDLKPLLHIRDMRVAAAGHPTLQNQTKKHPRRAHFISQATLGDSGMELMTVDASSQHIFRQVQIPELATRQEKYVLSLIRQAIAHLT